MPPYRQRSGGSPRAACGLLCAGRGPPRYGSRRALAPWAARLRPARPAPRLRGLGLLSPPRHSVWGRGCGAARDGGTTPFLGFPRTPFLTAAENSPLYRQSQPAGTNVPAGFCPDAVCPLRQSPCLMKRPDNPFSGTAAAVCTSSGKCSCIFLPKMIASAG